MASHASREFWAHIDQAVYCAVMTHYDRVNGTNLVDQYREDLFPDLAQLDAEGIPWNIVDDEGHRHKLLFDEGLLEGATHG